MVCEKPKMQRNLSGIEIWVKKLGKNSDNLLF